MSTDGIKSKQFGCYWKTMFLTALCYPIDINKCDNPQRTIRKYRQYYDSFEYVLPCRFCREFIKNTLKKEYPLDYSGRIALFKTIYIWKDIVNKKLYIQGVSKKKSPPFEKILKKYEGYRATSCSSGKTCI